VILRQALAAVGERKRGFATPGVAEEHALDGQRLALGRSQRARQLRCTGRRVSGRAVRRRAAPLGRPIPA
jgi:hypothetical protein